jgi:hypothetical protein
MRYCEIWYQAPIRYPWSTADVREGFFNEDRQFLSAAFAKFPPDGPGAKYVETCEFLASELVGLGLHVSQTFQAGEAQPVVEGTPGYEVMRDLVSDEICAKLLDHCHDMSWFGPVRTGAKHFWEAFLKESDFFLQDEVVDVVKMLQDGTLLKMLDIRRSPAAVERAREIHEVLSRTCCGYA